MEYSKIISVAGLPGLYELVATKTDGAIIRSLEDGSTKFVSSRVNNVSHLETIEVYTNSGENVNLVEVFKTMQESAEPLPSDKDVKAIKDYFEKVYPDMDFERVYASDMKKMIKWFSNLQKNNVEMKLRFDEEENGETEQAENDAVQTSDEA